MNNVLLFCRDQRKSLKRGLEMLAVGGKLMYTTSSYNPVENEAVVMHLLKECEGKSAQHDNKSSEVDIIKLFSSLTHMSVTFVIFVMKLNANK